MARDNILAIIHHFPVCDRLGLYTHIYWIFSLTSIPDRCFWQIHIPRRIRSSVSTNLPLPLHIHSNLILQEGLQLDSTKIEFLSNNKSVIIKRKRLKHTFRCLVPFKGLELLALNASKQMFNGFRTSLDNSDTYGYINIHDLMEHHFSYWDISLSRSLLKALVNIDLKLS